MSPVIDPAWRMRNLHGTCTALPTYQINKTLQVVIFTGKIRETLY
tara:strand:+ start:260 stop:394 length:135 start_codon:yes stop_codon:yes gene_type:complete